MKPSPDSVRISPRASYRLSQEDIQAGPDLMEDANLVIWAGDMGHLVKKTNLPYHTSMVVDGDLSGESQVAVKTVTEPPTQSRTELSHAKNNSREKSALDHS